MLPRTVLRDTAFYPELRKLKWVQSSNEFLRNEAVYQGRALAKCVHIEVDRLKQILLRCLAVTSHVLNANQERQDVKALRLARLEPSHCANVT